MLWSLLWLVFQLYECLDYSWYEKDMCITDTINGIHTELDYFIWEYLQ